MNIIQSYLVNNDCYKANVNKIDSRYVKFQQNGASGLMLHSVGCKQPLAKVFVNNWNKPNVKKCVHAFIDANTGDIYQTLPWNFRGWHSSSGSNGAAHDTMIGVEMCEPDCITYTSGSKFTCSDLDRARIMVTRTYKAAVELFAYLCKTYNIDPMNIISHAEGYKKGIASGHGDPEHLWNGLGMSYTMDTFRRDVKNAMGGSVASIQTPVTTTFTPYVVRIKADILNVRKGAGTSYPVVTTVKEHEAYTIVQEQNGWGKLKSGIGWICLKYTVKV